MGGQRATSNVFRRNVHLVERLVHVVLANAEQLFNGRDVDRNQAHRATSFFGGYTGADGTTQLRRVDLGSATSLATSKLQMVLAVGVVRI